MKSAYFWLMLGMGALPACTVNYYGVGPGGPRPPRRGYAGRDTIYTTVVTQPGPGMPPPPVVRNTPSGTPPPVRNTPSGTPPPVRNTPSTTNNPGGPGRTPSGTGPATPPPTRTGSVATAPTTGPTAGGTKATGNTGGTKATGAISNAPTGGNRTPTTGSLGNAPAATPSGGTIRATPGTIGSAPTGGTKAPATTNTGGSLGNAPVGGTKAPTAVGSQGTVPASMPTGGSLGNTPADVPAGGTIVATPGNIGQSPTKTGGPRRGGFTRGQLAGGGKVPQTGDGQTTEGGALASAPGGNGGLTATPGSISSGSSVPGTPTTGGVLAPVPGPGKTGTPDAPGSMQSNNSPAADPEPSGSMHNGSGKMQGETAGGTLGSQPTSNGGGMTMGGSISATPGTLGGDSPAAEPTSLGGGKTAMSGAEAVPALQFVKGPCRGTCPSYTATVWPGGRVMYVGAQNVARLGTYELQLPAATVTAMLRQARNIGFSELPKQYSTGATDLPATLLTIYQPDGSSQTMTVESGAPQEVQALLDYINDEVLRAAGSGADAPDSPRRGE